MRDIKTELKEFIIKGINKSFGDLDKGIEKLDIPLIRSQRREHGDFASGIPMVLAKIVKNSPRNIAELIKKEIETENPDLISRIEIAGGGFLNFFLQRDVWFERLMDIIGCGSDYGASGSDKSMKIQIEFVSANPTGPMNVVNARAAAIGDTLANILKNAGLEVTREYYINDSGVQIHNLGLSVEARMRELLGMEFEFPENGYMGEYIKDVAALLNKQIDDSFWEKEKAERIDIIKDKSLNFLVGEQRGHLENYGVIYDVWFSEKSLLDKGALEKTLDKLDKKNRTYEEDGAIWLKTSEFGDEKDRVLVKEDGQPTYFLADIAYHIDKYERQFDLIIDILGPDHHGHGIRMKAAMEALGYDPDKLLILIAQQVNLKKGGKAVKMSKRAGEFVTLDELVSDVGRDAARFFFLMRKAESHLDFDIDLAKKTSNENPVYYIQYAYARISSILRKAQTEGIKIDGEPADSTMIKLELQDEIELIKKLYDYEELMMRCAELYEPHRLSIYLVELAGMFHSYYNSNRVVSDDLELTSARIYLVRGIKIILNNALSIMGIKAPESM